MVWVFIVLSYWLLAIGYWLLAIGYWLLAVAFADAEGVVATQDLEGAIDRQRLYRRPAIANRRRAQQRVVDGFLRCLDDGFVQWRHAILPKLCSGRERRRLAAVGRHGVAPAN